MALGVNVHIRWSFMINAKKQTNKKKTVQEGQIQPSSFKKKDKKNPLHSKRNSNPKFLYLLMQRTLPRETLEAETVSGRVGSR